MQTAITVFTAHGQHPRIAHGPELLEIARERLHLAMRSGEHECGCVEIWTQRGVVESFVFKAATNNDCEDGRENDQDPSPRI